MSTQPPTLSAHSIVVGLWRLAQWKRDARATASWTEEILDLGIDTFDLADIYGGYSCELLFGDALRATSGLRDRLRIVTKCDIKLVHERRPGHTHHVYDTSHEHIVASVEESLRALGTDRVEVLLLHRQDPLMDPAEVASAFDVLHAAGKVLSFGVSNATPSNLSMLASYVKQPLVTNQVQASVLHLDPFQDGTLDQCLERRIRPMAWSPLAGGHLIQGDTERARRVREVLSAIAYRRGIELDTVAYAFLLRHPSRMHPMTGSGQLDRIQRAVAACDVELNREEWFEVWRASTGQPLP